MVALPLRFIQCPFPNQIQFGLEKLNPENACDFPNQFEFGLERNNSERPVDALAENSKLLTHSQLEIKRC